MATSHNLYLLSDSEATRITPNGIHSGIDITIQNVSDDQYIYIGASGVTSENYGYRIAPGHAISWELPGKNALYAIASADQAPAAVLNTSLEAGS
jgi:hypothetical protein